MVSTERRSLLHKTLLAVKQANVTLWSLLSMLALSGAYICDETKTKVKQNQHLKLKQMPANSKTKT